MGVLVATLAAGFATHWALGLPLLVALAFGAIMAAADPISVLSIFKEMTVPKKLSVIAEGESPFKRWSRCGPLRDSGCWNYLG